MVSPLVDSAHRSTVPVARQVTTSSVQRSTQYALPDAAMGSVVLYGFKSVYRTLPVGSNL